EQRGREAWHELHSQREPTPEWYEDWRKRIPNYGCSCRKNWAKLTKKYPPDFSSPRAFFEWSVARHNDVSTSHVSPPREAMPLDEAERIYCVPWRELCLD